MQESPGKSLSKDNGNVLLVSSTTGRLSNKAKSLVRISQLLILVELVPSVFFRIKKPHNENIKNGQNGYQKTLMACRNCQN